MPDRSSTTTTGYDFPVMLIDDLCETRTVNQGKPNERIEYTFSPDKACEAILERFRIISTTDKVVWVYHGGYYSPDGWDNVLGLVHSTAGDNFNKHYHAELEEKVYYATLARNPFNKNPYLFPAKDGVIDLQTGEIREHSPDDCLTFIYNAQCHYPNPDCRPFLWYLATTFPDIRDCLTVMDLITSIAIREPFDVFVFLLGGGENGKGVLEKVILALFTMQRASAMKIEEVRKSHFASGSLLNKDVWIITEVESVKDAISVIKGVSTGEMLDSDVKYGGRVQGTPHLLPIIDSNKALDFSDNSWGRRRRTLKLDCPYEFGYKPGTRPKNPNLLKELTAPEVLAGIVQIIRARAPALIESKRIYQRKSREAQEAELDRQRFSLQHFCNECLTADWLDPTPVLDSPATKPLPLRVDPAYQAYLEYCELFNVPEPAEKVPFGRYINEKYQTETAVSSERGEDGKPKSFRYYPGVHLVKSPVTAYAEFSFLYYEGTTDSISNTTDVLRTYISNNNNSKPCTTDTTDNRVLLNVLEELVRMYKYVQSCQNPQDISYRKFLASKSVVSVVQEKNCPSDNENLYYREKSTRSTTVVQDKSRSTTGDTKPAMGPNPCKAPVPVILRFLHDCPRIVAEDLKQPGNTRPYGPFKTEDLATLPSLNATGLIQKGVAVEVKT